MKHKNAEMIIAKVVNTELAVFVRVIDSQNESGSYWAPSSLSTLSIAENEFFICLPQHKEACLHWLNGGIVELHNDYKFNEFKPHSSWHAKHQFMIEKLNIRIKPKKEKRWIGFNSKTRMTTKGTYDDGVECECALNKVGEIYENHPWQFIEIEVEV